MTTDRLDQAVAIVAGASRGVGRAIATALSDAGAAVAVAARSVADIEELASSIEQSGGRAIAVRTDVTVWDDVVALVERTERELGPVDVMVNNAGGSSAIGPMWEVDDARWWHDVDLNFKGVVHGTRAMLPHMVARGSGRIINVGSRLGTVGSTYQSAYSAAKAAAMRFTECVALEVAPHGVVLFTMSPGLVRTAAFENAQTGHDGRRWLPELGDVPAERFTPPERAGALAVYLASGAADALTGRYVHVNDDEHDLTARADAIVSDDTLVLRLKR